MARRVVTVKGLKELEQNLAKLTKAAAKGVTQRTLKLAAVPMVTAAKNWAPVLTGGMKLSISASTKKPVNYDKGKIAYSQVLRNGGDKAAAVTAMRQARKENPNTFSEIFIGPSHKRFYASFVEYGTVHSAPNPFMRPAWDRTQDRCLEIIIEELDKEIDKSAARLARKALKGR